MRVGDLDLVAGAAAGHAPGTPVDLFIRPEHVRLEKMNGHIPPGAVAADIRESTFYGSLTRVRLSLAGMPDGAGLSADLPSEYAEGFGIGSRVLARWDAAAPRVMTRN